MKIIFPLLVLLVAFPVYNVYAEAFEDAKIYWKNEIVSPNSFLKITVEDNDMNLKEYPNFADKLSITVWSDSSQDPVEFELVETGVFTGVFTANIFIADSYSEGKKIYAEPGDFIYAKYVDSTTTKGAAMEVISAAVVKISGMDMSKFLEELDPSLRPALKSQVPDWIKNNAMWWGQGQIDDSSFVGGIEFLIRENILEIPPPSDKFQRSEEIPGWVKTNALWWAEGQTSDNEFISAMGHLIGLGLISVESEDTQRNSQTEPAQEDSELEKCQNIKKAYDRLNCEKEEKFKAKVAWYKENSAAYQVGNAMFYYPGTGNPGNSFEVNSSGQALLYIRILVENTGPSENVSLFCSGPSVCNYDVWDGAKVFKYSSQDFTSGQIVLKPGDKKEFNMFFGPNIGYGGTQFEYDPGKQYFFRVLEPWGSLDIPLNLEN